MRRDAKGAPTNAFFPLSPLLAHTCTPDRRKSFISTHITNDPRGGGLLNFGEGTYLLEFIGVPRQEAGYVKLHAIHDVAKLRV
jgi:hypothetical protein